jgi:hypothetical protein
VSAGEHPPQRGTIDPSWGIRKLFGSATTSQVMAQEATDVLPHVLSKIAAAGLAAKGGDDFVRDTFCGHLKRVRRWSTPLQALLPRPRGARDRVRAG